MINDRRKSPPTTSHKLPAKGDAALLCRGEVDSRPTSFPKSHFQKRANRISPRPGLFLAQNGLGACYQLLGENDRAIEANSCGNVKSCRENLSR
jgi:hypothetical protein